MSATSWLCEVSGMWLRHTRADTCEALFSNAQHSYQTFHRRQEWLPSFSQYCSAAGEGYPRSASSSSLCNLTQLAGKESLPKRLGRSGRPSAVSVRAQSRRLECLLLWLLLFIDVFGPQLLIEFTLWLFRLFRRCQRVLSCLLIVRSTRWRSGNVFCKECGFFVAAVFQSARRCLWSWWGLAVFRSWSASWKHRILICWST